MTTVAKDAEELLNLAKSGSNLDDRPYFSITPEYAR